MGSGRCYVRADTELRTKKRDPSSAEPRGEIRIGEAELRGEGCALALPVRETTVAPGVALGCKPSIQWEGARSWSNVGGS